jgi:hypothetical protein
MDNLKLKNYLFNSLIAALLIVSFSVFYFVLSYSSFKNYSSRSFRVSSSGKVSVVPNIAIFSASVVSEGKDLKNLQDENAKRLNNVLNFLKEQGIESKDIKTTDYNIIPQYEYYPCGNYEGSLSKKCPPPKIVGYSILQTLEVKVRDFSKVGDILSGVVEGGANQVSGLRFTVDNYEDLELQAKEVAIANAKKSALEIAKSGNFKLGKIISVDFYRSGNIPGQYLFSKAEGVSASPNIEPGTQEINVVATIQYEIK